MAARMYKEKRSFSKISEALNCNCRTVKKYLEMEDQKFKSILKTQSARGNYCYPMKPLSVSTPFTSHSAILAHESTFKYMDEIPVEVSCDQFKTYEDSTPVKEM